MNEDRLVDRLPIAKNESIKHIIRHHWIIYVGPYLTAFIGSMIILAGAYFVNDIIGFLGGEINRVLIGLIAFILIVGIFALASIPAYMRSQEMLILTEATLLLQRKPDIFAVKISQLNLKHVEDVNIERRLLGNVFNYGRLNIETAGEMENFIFDMVANIDDVARLIINSHENYIAALQTGHIQTTIESREPIAGNAWHGPASWPGGQPDSFNKRDYSPESTNTNEPKTNTVLKLPEQDLLSPDSLSGIVSSVNKDKDTNI